MEIPPKVFTIDPSDSVDIAMTNTGLGALTPITVGQAFRMTVDKYSHLPALAVLNDIHETEESKVISFAEYYYMCLQVAKSLLKLGLKQKDRVGILCFDSPEWSLSCIGAIFSGGIPCSIPLCNAEEYKHIINESKASVVIIESNEQLENLIKILDQLPTLQFVVSLSKPNQTLPNLYEWNEFLKLGKDIEDNVIEKLVFDQNPNDCGAICYTSGTTGAKKGVMFSQDNLTWTAQNIELNENVFKPGHHILAYLGSSIGAQLVQLYIPLCKGLTVYFAPPNATKVSNEEIRLLGGIHLIKTLCKVRPHFFLGAPQVWEYFMKSALDAIPEVSSSSEKERIKEKVLVHLGLNNCQKLMSAGAPFHTVLREFYEKLGIDITNSWGMTEGGGMAVTPHFGKKSGSVGKAHPGIEITISKPNPVTKEGEICLRGRNIMIGYLNQLKETSQVIDSHKWLHTKDIGHIDDEGFLFITGRIKDVFLTSTGVTILPGPIEDKIKAIGAHLISNAVIVGENYPFIACLITLKCTFDTSNGAPTDELTIEAQNYLLKLGSSITCVSKIIETKDTCVYDSIQQIIDTVNTNAFSSDHQIKKFIILDKDFSCFGGEIDNNSLKFKRRVVLEKYKEQIELIYK